MCKVQRWLRQLFRVYHVPASAAAWWSTVWQWDYNKPAASPAAWAWSASAAASYICEIANSLYSYATTVDLICYLLGVKVAPNPRQNCLLMAVASPAASCYCCSRRIAIQRRIQIRVGATWKSCLATPSAGAALHVLQIAIRLNKFQRDKISALCMCMCFTKSTSTKRKCL